MYKVALAVASALLAILMLLALSVVARPMGGGEGPSTLPAGVVSAAVAPDVRVQLNMDER